LRREGVKLTDIDATIVAPASFAANEIQQIPQEKPREAAIVSALKLRHIA
jgi:hypothetical protein